ncbi:O-antigen ligase [Melghiribacillus thermohalophilus]|uniref:O-antigen ligase n=1 Tax=Melghiribacillus thermohalophilus TaxID=1324956 RepID=A0A4R3MTV6_9BACI|nr:O-antigen ligase family protein [Melghiribacillus thermohalophilus]TCT19880.1 O-antigen ligase [Melghiribacillus thermohalophilus]
MMKKLNFLINLPNTLFILLILNILELTTQPELITIGKTGIQISLFISLILFLYFIVFQTKKSVLTILPIFISLTAIAFLYTLSHLYNRNFDNDRILATFMITLMYLVVLTHIDWKKKHFNFISFTSIILVLLLFINWLSSDMPFQKFEGIIRNPNLTGIFLFILMFFQLLGLVKGKILYNILIVFSIIINLFLIYVTTSRTVYLSIFIIILSLTVMKFSKKLYKYLFYIFVLFNLTSFFVYFKLYNSSYRNILNEWSREYFNKNFFSGRQTIWDEAVKYGIQSPIIGHKVGIKPDEYLSTKGYAHVHNQYLQIFLESGMLGFISFLIFLVVLWKYLSINLESYVIKLSSSFYLGIIVYQNYELNLLLVNKSIGFLLWLIIFLGVGFSIRIKHKSRKENPE